MLFYLVSHYQGAWLTTSGLHSGMIRDVGEALREYAIGRALADHRSVVVLGIAPLSILKHKQKLTSSQAVSFLFVCLFVCLFLFLFFLFFYVLDLFFVFLFVCFSVFFFSFCFLFCFICFVFLFVCCCCCFVCFCFCFFFITNISN